MRFLIVLCVVYSLGAMGWSESVPALDDDFFGSDSTPYGGPGARSLDPDFFDSRPNLNNVPVDSFGCINISANSPKGETARVQEAISKNCGGSATRMWIPRPARWRNANQPLGYHQICCTKRADSARRKRRN